MIYDIDKLRCQCGKCQDSGIDPVVISVLEFVSVKAPEAAVVCLSGRRCDAHNKSVGGSKNSNHKKGIAIDLTLVVDGVISQPLLNKIANEIVKGLDDQVGYGAEVLVYKTFLHVALRQGLPTVFKNMVDD